MPYNEQFDLPYDPNSQSQQVQTLPLDEVIRRAILAYGLKLKVCLPCSVTAIHGDQLVDVQPLLQARYTSGNPFTLSQIQRVPVSMPMGANYSIKVPVAINDTGYCIFSDRSLDVWLAGSGAVVDPQDSRAHDIADAIFVPGLVPTANQTEDGTTDLVITNGEAQMKLQAGGTFLFKGPSQEIMAVIDSLFDILINNTFTNTMIGPQPFIAGTITALTQLRAKWDALKGS